MYKIEYQQDNGLVTSITDATETPVTLQDEGVAYYKGEIPEDREGFTKELYWGVDPEVNVNTKARIANSETLYAVYTTIEGWLELATMEYVSGVEGKTAQLEQDVSILSVSNLKKVGEFTFPDERRIIDVASVDFANKTVTLAEPHGITDVKSYASFCFFILKTGIDAQIYGQDPAFEKATSSLNFINQPVEIIDEITLKFSTITNNNNSKFDASFYSIVITTENLYQRKIELTEPCIEYKVVAHLSKYTGGLGSYDVSSPVMPKSCGSSITEYTFRENSPYSCRAVCTNHYGRSPMFDGTTNPKDVTMMRYSFERLIKNKIPITSFSIYNYGIPYVAGDKIEIYKMN